VHAKKKKRKKKEKKKKKRKGGVCLYLKLKSVQCVWIVNDSYMRTCECVLRICVFGMSFTIKDMYVYESV
jgi:hypothetical protein